jgi:CrcB protein
MTTQISVFSVGFCAIGGALGAISRMLIAVFVASFKPDFPYATLLINVLGCFVLGLLIPLAFEKAVLSPNLQALLMIGFLGAFTTFSAFTYESYQLLKYGAYFTWALNIAANILLCLAAFALAMKISYQL